MADQFYSTGDVEGLLAVAEYMDDMGWDIDSVAYYIRVKMAAEISDPSPLSRFMEK